MDTLSTPAAAASPGRRRGDRWLVGCGLACGGLVLLGVLGIAAATWWALSPGDQAPTRTVATDDSLGVVEIDGLAEDEGTRELLDRVLSRAERIGQEQQREALPPSLRWLSDLRGSRSSSAGLGMLIPHDLTIAFERGEGGEPTLVVAANFKAMVRPIRFALEHATDSDLRLADYRGQRLLLSDDGSGITFVGGTLVYADTVPALERAVDRLRDGRSAAGRPAEAGPARPRVAIPEGSWDLVGRLSDEEALLSDYLERWPGGEAESEPWREPGEGPAEAVPAEVVPAEAVPADLAFGLDVESADAIHGRVVLAAASPETAEAWRRRLATRWQALAERLERRGARLEWSDAVVGERVETELRVVGLETAADRLLERLERTE